MLILILFSISFLGCRQSDSQSESASVESATEEDASDANTENDDSTDGDAQAIIDTSATTADSSPDSSSEWSFLINTKDLYGNEITNESFYDNKLTVLNIWATWCGPCVAELPTLQAVSLAYADKGVQIVGVVQDAVTELRLRNDSVATDAINLLEDAGATYTVILPDKTLDEVFISTMEYFPTTFFIDSNGNVVNTVIGSNDFEGWSTEIDETLAKL
jgi:thiol-disulfide isomerase/thioredoxin